MLASDPRGDTVGALSFSLATDIVELVILTTDDGFLQTLREAVGPARRLWHVPSSDKVSDLLLAGQVGIVVLDAQALHETVGTFVEQVKRQFPDLVVVVAGNREDESALAGLISASLVYRFIHKPMSPNRARSFAEAAVKKYDEQRKRVAAVPQRSAVESRKTWTLAAAALGAFAVSVAVLWTFQARTPTKSARGPAPATDDKPTSSESPRLARAAAALADNRLTAPSGDNALELYLQELARSPSDPTARAGLAEVHDRLLARAESALLEERLDEAAAAIDVARHAGVESGRISFLSQQLAKSRSQRRAAPQGQAAAQGPGWVPGSAAAQAPSDAPVVAPGAAAAPAQQVVAQGPPGPPPAQAVAAQGPAAAPEQAAGQGPPVAPPVVPEATAAPISGSEGPIAKTESPDAPAAAASPAGADSPQPATQLRNPQAIVVDARELTLVKSVKPSYPHNAELAKIEGWVELDFTVGQSGQVKEIEIHAAAPPTVFSAAAIGALAQWRYAPILVNGTAVEQRARIRVRFTLHN